MMFSRKCFYIMNGQEKRCSFHKLSDCIRNYVDARVFVVPEEMELLQISNMDLSKFHQIVLKNKDSWLILDHCTFSGEIFGGNVSLYPKHDENEKGVSFLENQEVEIIFDKSFALTRPLYNFSRVNQVSIQGNATGCSFRDSFRDSYSSPNLFSCQNVKGGDVMVSANRIYILNSTLEYFDTFYRQKYIAIQDSFIHHFPSFSNSTSHLYLKNATFNTEFGKMEFLKDEPNCSGNLALARTNFTKKMLQLQKRVLEQQKCETEQMESVIEANHANMIDYYTSKVATREKQLETAKQGLESIKSQMTQEIKEGKNILDNQSVGRILKKEEN